MSSTLARLSVLAAFAGAIAVLVSAAASGRERHASRANLPRANAPRSIAPPTRIEVDNQAHEIRFYVNGEQITMLDSLGLHGATAH